MLPNGQANFKLNNYQSFLLLEDNESLINLLKKIANVKEDDKDIEFDVKRDENGEFKIGNLSFGELLSYYTFKLKR